jgi:hypothetical protein
MKRGHLIFVAMTANIPVPTLYGISRTDDDMQRLLKEGLPD